MLLVLMVKPLNSELEAAADYNSDALHPLRQARQWYCQRGGMFKHREGVEGVGDQLKPALILPQSKPVSTCVQPFS